MKVLGIDIGFGQVKVISGDSKFKFPTQIAQYLDDAVSDVQVVSHEGVKYVVGEDAVSFRQKLSLSSVPLLLKYAPVLLKYVLMQVSGDEFFVVSGLPPRFKDAGKDLERVMLSVEKVKRVFIVPQGVGVLEDVKEYVASYDSALILDVGFNTVDYISIKIRDKGVIKERSGTIEALGVRNAVEIFRNLLPAEVGYYRNEPYVFLVPYLIKGRIAVAGKEVFLYEEKKRACQLWSEQIYLRLSEEIGELIKGKSLFVVAGGGAYFLDKSVFERDVYVPREPDFSNARGYYKIGISLAEGGKI